MINYVQGRFAVTFITMRRNNFLVIALMFCQTLPALLLNKCAFSLSDTPSL